MVINKILIYLVLILTFNCQSLAKADDIRDFQIEGISIGDSLIDYFTKKEINKEKNIELNIQTVINLLRLHSLNTLNLKFMTVCKLM